MKFIVGVGNPGKAYEKTRHNVGFEVVDTLQERKNCSGLAKLIKPETFVNSTGRQVVEIVKKKLGTAADILIVCDDVNLAFGKIRLRPSGSAGGHHGLESVIGELGTEDFARLRIGVGQADMPKDLTHFVLGKFDADERKSIGTILERAALVCEAWAKEGYAPAEKRLSQLQSKP